MNAQVNLMDKEIAANAKLATRMNIVEIGEQMLNGNSIADQLKALDYNQDVFEAALENGLNSLIQIASRPGIRPSQYPLSSTTLANSVTHLHPGSVPNESPEKLVDYLLNVSRAHGFTNGQRTLENAVLSTYHVIRRLLACIMREFADLIVQPGETLVRDATGMLVLHETGELRSEIEFDDQVISVEDIEHTANVFYHAIVDHPEIKRLLLLATKYAPSDVHTDAKKRKIRVPRQMFFSAGIRAERDELGNWLPERPLSWDQLICRDADAVSTAAPRAVGAAW